MTRRERSGRELINGVTPLPVPYYLLLFSDQPREEKKKPNKQKSEFHDEPGLQNMGWSKSAARAQRGRKRDGGKTGKG